LLSGLRPGGIFYARTPSLAPILRIFQFLRLPYDFTFPAHVHDLGQKFWESILDCLPLDRCAFQVLLSRPSIVETSFRSNPLRTAISYLLKSPWYILHRHYRLIGGWEVVIHRCVEK
jgi:hypothetical protein